MMLTSPLVYLTCLISLTGEYVLILCVFLSYFHLVHLAGLTSLTGGQVSAIYIFVVIIVSEQIHTKLPFFEQCSSMYLQLYIPQLHCYLLPSWTGTPAIAHLGRRMHYWGPSWSSTPAIARCDSLGQGHALVGTPFTNGRAFHDLVRLSRAVASFSFRCISIKTVS